MTTEERFILENQVAIMTALLTLKEVKAVARVEADLYYHIAKTGAYLPKESRRDQVS